MQSGSGRFTERSFRARLRTATPRLDYSYTSAIPGRSIFLACCIKHVTRTFVSCPFLRARGWPVSKQAGPRCPRYHASIRGDESVKASGNTRNQRREGIFCDSRRPEARVLSKGRKGPAGVGPVLSGAGRLFTSDCRGRHGRHDPRRALRRSRRVPHHRLARRRNYRARRCAPSEDALR